MNDTLSLDAPFWFLPLEMEIGDSTAVFRSHEMPAAEQIALVRRNARSFDFVDLRVLMKDMSEVEILICNFYLSVAARKIVWADPSLRYIGMFAVTLSNQQTATSLSQGSLLRDGVEGGRSISSDATRDPLQHTNRRFLFVSAISWISIVGSHYLYSSPLFLELVKLVVTISVCLHYLLNKYSW